MSSPRFRGLATAALFAGLLGVLALFTGCGGTEPSGEGTLPAPAGAPFSFEVPEGFELAEDEPPARGAKFLTTVVPAGAAGEGAISAFQWRLSPTQQLFSKRRLLSWIELRTRSFYGGGSGDMGRAMPSDVGGHEAICWMVHGIVDAAEGSVDADVCAIVSGHEVIQQECTWEPGMRTRIERGCAEIRGSLRLS